MTALLRHEGKDREFKLQPVNNGNYCPVQLITADALKSGIDVITKMTHFMLSNYLRRYHITSAD